MARRWSVPDLTGRNYGWEVEIGSFVVAKVHSGRLVISC